MAKKREIRKLTDEPAGLSKRQLRNRGIVVIDVAPGEVYVDYSHSKRDEAREGELVAGGRIQKIRRRAKEIDGDVDTTLQDKLFTDVRGETIIKHRWLGEPRER